MARLIDADRIEYIDGHLIINEYLQDEYDGEFVDKYSIDNLPTIDAVPVRHGQWETNSDRPDTLICSVCKCGFDMWKHDPHNFCPNCGAKMDGDENG